MKRIPTFQKFTEILLEKQLKCGGEKLSINFIICSIAICEPQSLLSKSLKKIPSHDICPEKCA
jgi:hypothetical protein